GASPCSAALSGPAASLQRERAARVAELLDELCTRRLAAFAVERRDPSSHRPGAAEQRRPVVLEVLVVGLDVQRCRLGSGADELLDLWERAIAPRLRVRLAH